MSDGLEKIRQELAGNRAKLEEGGKVQAEEMLLLEMLKQQGYKIFIEEIFERPDDEVKLAANMNMRIAVSHLMAAKVKIAENALGHELSGKDIVKETSHLSKLESDVDKVIQLGLILKAMRENPRGPEWNDIINDAALNAVGIEAENWVKEVKTRAEESNGRGQDRFA